VTFALQRVTGSTSCLGTKKINCWAVKEIVNMYLLYVNPVFNLGPAFAGVCIN